MIPKFSFEEKQEGEERHDIVFMREPHNVGLLALKLQEYEKRMKEQRQSNDKGFLDSLYKATALDMLLNDGFLDSGAFQARLDELAGGHGSTIQHDVAKNAFGVIQAYATEEEQKLQGGGLLKIPASSLGLSPEAAKDWKKVRRAVRFSGEVILDMIPIRKELGNETMDIINKAYEKHVSKIKKIADDTVVKEKDPEKAKETLIHILNEYVDMVMSDDEVQRAVAGKPDAEQQLKKLLIHTNTYLVEMFSGK